MASFAFLYSVLDRPIPIIIITRWATRDQKRLRVTRQRRYNTRATVAHLPHVSQYHATTGTIVLSTGGSALPACRLDVCTTRGTTINGQVCRERSDNRHQLATKKKTTRFSDRLESREMYL